MGVRAKLAAQKTGFFDSDIDPALLLASEKDLGSFSTLLKPRKKHFEKDKHRNIRTYKNI